MQIIITCKFSKRRVFILRVNLPRREEKKTNRSTELYNCQFQNVCCCYLESARLFEKRLATPNLDCHFRSLYF